MYEPLEACAVDFNDLQTVLADPAGADRVAAILAALDATAQRIAETVGDSEAQRHMLATLYRGMQAASRIVAHLQEQRALAGNTYGGAPLPSN